MKILSVLILIFAFSSISILGQTKPVSNNSVSNSAKATPAYAELLLRRTELESNVESWLETYTEDYPKLKETRYELELINKDLTTLLAQTDTGKLTLALGKLLVRKNEIATDLWVLENKFGKDHPDVKRNQRKLESFQKAVKEILP